MNRNIRVLITCCILFAVIHAQVDTVMNSRLNNYKLYPEVNEQRPDLPSPFISEEGEEYIVAFTQYGKFAIIPVTLSNDKDFAPQLLMDTLDFPLLARYGLHDNKLLNSMNQITGWDLDTITALGRPGGLSTDGFLAEDENIRSILIHDNSLVFAMGLTHPEMAKPLFHFLNMMGEDLKLHRWNMKKHKWEHITCFYYNSQVIYVDVEDTKGGQQSIFNDGIQGAFHIKLRRRAEPNELALLARTYHDLSTEDYELLKEKLFTLSMGEMEAQYIMRYGFYEGHTYWRTDPVTIALVFGLRTLPEIEEVFSNELYKVLTEHAVAQP
ncbi:MAG: hypothetical protein K9N05_05710 [Candidatus Marinimicrobia bacterium]|nr:hypothetical protein [Candidatus Neomarinimicrobiota bacterium]